MSKLIQTDSAGQPAWLRELGRIRHTVESIGIAVVLAFVLRAFTIEAFVIPTGSMAPRLLGAHWHLQCTECGYTFDYRWGDRTPPTGNNVRPAPTAVCPMCRRSFQATPRRVVGGDRVLVLKFLYNFAPPQPWDVVVFRNPQNNVENYIKRLIGTPGETIELIRGDVWVKTDADAPWTIRRKPDHVQRVMWQLIHDNDYQLTNRTRTDQAPQWLPETPGWSTSPDGRRFTFTGGSTGRIQFDAPLDAFLPHYGYNMALDETRGTTYFDKAICTDLKLSAIFTPRADDSHVLFGISVLGNDFAGSFAADGTLKLLARPTGREWVDWKVWAETKLDKPFDLGQGRAIALATVDSQVQLILDDKVVLRSTDEELPADRDAASELMAKVATNTNRITDTIPKPFLTISADGGQTDLSHLKVLRDVYYTDCRLREPLGDYAKTYMGDEQRGWGTWRNPITLQGDPNHPKDTDSFYVLGDNSPQSLDSRHWCTAAASLRLFDKAGNPIYQIGTVPRYQMIGKAIFVYWPSGYALPEPLTLPIVPNTGDMRMIR